MWEVIQILVNGLSMGGMYALVALSLTLIFGVANILNIGQVETIMLAPAALLIGDHLNVPLWVSLPASLAFTMAGGILFHLIGVRPFSRRHRRGAAVDHLAPLVATFGLATFVAFAMSRVIGTQPDSFPVDIPQSLWRVGNVLIVPMEVVDLAVCAATLVVLMVVMRRSRLGLALRVVAESPTIAECLGLDAERVATLTAVVAALLGGIAGLLLGATTGSVSAFMGIEYGLKGMVAMILGGVNSLSGAVLAGLMIGVIEAFLDDYVSSSLSPGITFGILILFLVVRPNGLLGKHFVERV